MRYELSDYEWNRHQADAAEQVARYPARERPTCPLWRLWGLAIETLWRDPPRGFGLALPGGP